MKLSNRVQTAYFLIVLGALFFAYRWYAQSLKEVEARRPYTVLRGEIFHTFYQIKYDRVEDYAEDVDSIFKVFSHSLNPFEPTSLISAINRNESAETDSMLRHVWRAAERISEASHGRYDVTCSPLINAWGFGFDSLDRVDDRVLDSLCKFVGYRSVHLSGDRLIKRDRRTIIDLSSISKGYCSDLVGQMLQARGAQSYMVELGGEIAFSGVNPQGTPWTVGINKPIEDPVGFNQDLELIISLDRPRGGLATSGNYRNYKVVNGRKVAHTIDPFTGYPVQTDVLSATILAPSCMLADGLATACMTMSSDDVPEFLTQFEDVEYLLILAGEDDEFITKMSEGFQRLVVR